MKKIITVLTALLLLVGTLFSLASCGEVDMDELEYDLQDSGYYYSSIQADDSKGVVGGYKVYYNTYYSSNGNSSTGTRELKIIEYATIEIAKLYWRQCTIDQKSEDVQDDIDEAVNTYNGITSVTDISDVDSEYETVVKLKGNVVVYGDKELYKEIF